MEDPQDLAERSAEAMYREDVASRHLGIAVDGIAPGRATARMRVLPTMVNGHGICHGGYVFLLADTAFAFAGNTYGFVTLAAQCDVVFVAPVRVGEDLVAEAFERVRAGRTGVYDVVVRKADGTPVAEFRGTSRTLRDRLPTTRDEA